MAKKPVSHLSEKSIGDPVDFQDLEQELSRLRSAIVLLANCMGAHIISQDSARRLMELLAPPHERHERGRS